MYPQIPLWDMVVCLRPCFGTAYSCSCIECAGNRYGNCGRGWPWWMAVLAAYMLEPGEESLADYLDNRIFAGQRGSTVDPVKEDVEGFDAFVATYKATLPAQIAAVEGMKVRRNA